MPDTRERFSRLILTRTLCGEFVGLGPEGGTEKKELAEGRTAHAQYRWQSRALNRPPGSRVHTKHRPPGPPACPGPLARLQARRRQEKAQAGEEPPRVTPKDLLSQDAGPNLSAKLY